MRRALEILNGVARIATLDLELRPMLQRITDALASMFGRARNRGNAARAQRWRAADAA